MPGGVYQPARCTYALLGDFNSNASVGDRGHDLADSDVGAAALASINTFSPGHKIALPPGKKTSIGGERYDELIVHEAAMGRRRGAHVYPSRESLVAHMAASVPEAERGDYKSVHMAFCNIFTDHLPVFVDLEFPPSKALHAGPLVAKPVLSGSLPATDTAHEMTCKNCSSGKGCRYRGKPGHVPLQ